MTYHGMLQLSMLLAFFETGMTKRVQSFRATSTGGQDNLNLPTASDPKTVIIVGGTGEGKSNFANWMAGEDNLFHAESSQTSVTTKHQEETRNFFGKRENGKVRLVDLPGLGDTNGKSVDKKQWDDSVKFMMDQIKEAHAVILVLNSQKRATNEVSETIKQLRDSFGEEFWRILRVVLTFANKWDEDKYQKEIISRRAMLLTIEEGLIGRALVTDETRKWISQVPIYAADLPPWFLNEDGRMERLLTDEAEILLDSGIADFIKFDADLQAKYKENKVSSFGKWTLKHVKATKQKLDKVLPANLYQWGKNYGQLNVGRLEALRQDVLATREPLMLDLRKMAGKTSRVFITIKAGELTLAKTPFDLAAETKVKQLREQAVFPNKIVQDMKIMRASKTAGKSAMGWLADEVTIFRGELALITDNQLRREAKAILKNKSNDPTNLVAQVYFASGSPPDKLDNDLLRVCVEENDIRAAANLVKDHLTLSSQLALLSDLGKALPHTKAGSGKVFQRLEELRKTKVNNFRADDDNQARANQKRKRDETIKDVEATRKQLQPYVDEVKNEANNRAAEAEEMRNNMAQKVTQMLNVVRNGVGGLELPNSIPEAATSQGLLDFVDKVEADLNYIEEVAKREIVTADVLISRSLVLKGMYLGLVPRQSADDLVQVTNVPAIDSILIPPDKEHPMETKDEKYQSQASFDRASSLMTKGGASFTSSFAGSGAMVSSYGIGAFHQAGKIATASENLKEVNEKGRKEEHTFYMLRNHYYPMQMLQLDGSMLRFTPEVMTSIVGHLMGSSDDWFNQIYTLLYHYGTHYCPSVMLGGSWTQEARFEDKRSWEETDLKEAISERFESEFKGGGAFFGSMGFGGFSMAGNGHSDHANAEAQKNKTMNIMKKTTISRRCVSNSQQCPTSDKTFIKALSTNGNWAVIDRNMEKCVPIWQALTLTRHKEEIFEIMEEKDQNYSQDRAEELLKKWIKVAQKVWHLKILNLPRLCQESNPPDDVKTKCAELSNVAEAEPGRISEVSTKVISETWAAMQTHTDEEKSRTEQCAAMDFCNNLKNQGQCVWKDIENTNVKIMTCACYPYYTGTKCENEIPKKSCTDIKENYCTAHPLAWYQPDCDVHGAGYKYHDWKYCGQIFSGYSLCKKTWECAPETENDDCCT